MPEFMKSVLVFVCQVVLIRAQCPPGFECSGPDCYLIFPVNGGWKYQEPGGNTRDTPVDDVYSNPNCYKFVQVTKKQRSCIDTQRECEMIGGNITVINSSDEYHQLIDNVLEILYLGFSSKFNVHLQKNFSSGCAIIEVHDRVGSGNIIGENMDCSATDEVNTIICESNDLDPGICPVPTIVGIKIGDTTTTTTNTPTDLFECNDCYAVVVALITLISLSSAVIITIGIVGFVFILGLRNKSNKTKKQNSDRNHGEDNGAFIPDGTDSIGNRNGLPIDQATVEVGAAVGVSVNSERCPTYEKVH